jgi:hypothetical protein
MTELEFCVCNFGIWFKPYNMWICLNCGKYAFNQSYIEFNYRERMDALPTTSKGGNR